MIPERVCTFTVSIFTFTRSQIGRTESVLVETRNKDGYYEGYTMNYTPVRLMTTPDNINRLLNIRLTELVVYGNLKLSQLAH